MAILPLLHLQATADTGFWAEVPITRPRRAGFLGGCEGMKPQQVNGSWTGLGALARMPLGLGVERQPPRPLEITARLPCPLEGMCHTESRASLSSLLTCQCPCSWLLTHQTLGAQAAGLALLLLGPSTPDAQ